jgi:hypothetical protein
MSVFWGVKASQTGLQTLAGGLRAGTGGNFWEIQAFSGIKKNLNQHQLCIRRYCFLLCFLTIKAASD